MAERECWELPNSGGPREVVHNLTYRELRAVMIERGASASSVQCPEHSHDDPGT